MIVGSCGGSTDNIEVKASNSSTIQFSPTDDAGPNNYDEPPNVDVMWCGQWAEWEAYAIVYFKYDLAGNIPAGTTITQATITFVVADPYIGNGGTLSIGEVSDDSWEEETINWTNKPELGSVITTASYPAGGYLRLYADVTSYISSEFGGDGIASLWIYSLVDSQFVELCSKEITDPDDPPYLEVTYTAAICGVEVAIENKLLEGPPSTVLAYTISVHNSGNVVDNIVLSYIPDGWPDIHIEPPVLIDVAPCETRQATLFVHVPDGAAPCTYKEIIVIAESMFCHATDNDNALAHVTEAPRCGVEVIIENKLLEGPPSTVLAYTISVHNSGNVVDNIVLSYIPDGWPDIHIEPPVLIDVLPCETRQATLYIHVPENALGCTYKEIIVIAESMFCHATGNDNALAHVLQLPGPNVDVSISPSWDEALPGESLYYTVVITNTGTVDDNYDITISETEPWGSHFSTVNIEPTDDAQPNTPFYSDTVDYGTLFGPEPYLISYWDTTDYFKIYMKFDLSSVPDGATIDDAKVWFYCGVLELVPWHLYCYSVDDDTWTEHTITYLNEPAYNEPALDEEWVATMYPEYAWYSWDVTSFVQSEFAGDKFASVLLWYTSPPPSDYSVIWGPSKEAPGNHPYLEVTYAVLPYTPPPIPPGENKTITLTVPIPLDAVPCTTNEITVTATSQTDNTVSDSDTCQAHAKAVCGVEVIIENKLLEGPPSTVLAYTISVHNSGNVVDNIMLSYIPDGWPDIHIEPPVLIDVAPCEVRQATLFVHVPDGAAPCTYKEIIVIAESMFCHATDNDNATAHVTENWTGSATFSLVTLYKLNLYKDNLWLYDGKKLVVKFYTYGNVFENESVIHEGFALPWRVVPENENVSHPSGIGIKKARLDLTEDNTENVISTIASFVASRTILMGRLGDIDLFWPFSSLEEKTQLMAELSDTDLLWPFAPLTGP